MAVCDNIKRIRKERHITQAQLADAVKVSQQTIQRYESGEITNIPYDNIVALSNALHVSPSAIMGWDAESDRYARISAYAKKMMELTGEHQRQIMELIDLYADKDGDANGKI